MVEKLTKTFFFFVSCNLLLRSLNDVLLTIIRNCKFCSMVVWCILREDFVILSDTLCNNFSLSVQKKTST